MNVIRPLLLLFLVTVSINDSFAKDNIPPAKGIIDVVNSSDIQLKDSLINRSPNYALPIKEIDHDKFYKRSNASLIKLATACDDSAFVTSGDALLLAIRTQGVSCVNRLFDLASEAIRLGTFTESNMIFVANAAKDESVAYTGLDTEQYLESLYTWIKAAYFYGNRQLLTPENQAATRAALEAFVTNSHFYDKNSAHADLVYAAMVNLNNGLVGDHFIYLVADLLVHYDESFENISGWGGAFAEIFWNVMYQCQISSECRIAKVDTSLMKKIGDFIFNNLTWLDTSATDYHLHNLGYHLALVYQGIGETHFEALRSELELQLNKVFSQLGPLEGDAGRRGYLQSLAEVNRSGQCSLYNLCTKIDEIIVAVLDNRIDCPSGTLFMWAQDMNQAQLDWACSSLVNHESYFHTILKTESTPVTPDDNAQLRMVVFNNSHEWHVYGYVLFGASTNNGGLYLEGDPSTPGDQATFFAYENVPERPIFDIWNLRHEYIHYLDGRFIKQGDFAFNNGTGRTVWYGEGIAEYISKRDCNDNAIAQAADATYALSTIFTNEYTDSQTRIYPWGYLAVRFMFEEKNAEFFAMLELFKQGSYQEYRDTLVDVWVDNKSFDADFEAWLPTVESLNCTVDATRPESPIEPINVDDVQGNDQVGFNACVEGTPVGNQSIEAGVAVCLADSSVNNQAQMALYVPTGLVDVTLKITLRHGSGDAYLLHKFDSRPNASDYDFLSDGPGSDETILVNPVQEGWNYIHVPTNSEFSGVTLLARYIQNDGTNTLPIANSGLDVSVDEQTLVTLNGAGSNDSDGAIVSYAWSQIEITGSTVLLSNDKVSNPTFTTPIVPAIEILTFELTVTDNEGATHSDRIKVTVNPGKDTDGDGLTDYEEVNIYGTNPMSGDSDGDGLSDYDEINTHDTNPNNKDSDEDGMEDGYEIDNDFNPNVEDCPSWFCGSSSKIWLYKIIKDNKAAVAQEQ